MTKYNPTNLMHRKWMADNILNMARRWGFTVIQQDKTWEIVMEKVNKFDPTRKTIIYTSVDRKTGILRDHGDDRIRVVAKANDTYQRVKRINRTGEFRAITDRMIEGILLAQKVK